VLLLKQEVLLVPPDVQARAEPAHYATALRNAQGNFGNDLENLSVAISPPGPTFAFKQNNRERSLAGSADEKGAQCRQLIR